MLRPLALPLAAVALALALAAASPARADPPLRVVVRLDYLRGPGAESCPATDSALREEVARLMGYDPFDPSAPARLAVVVERQTRGWAAQLQRFDAAGAQTWGSTFRGRGDDCAALFPPLASALRGWLLQGAPATLPPASGRLFGVDGFEPPDRPRAPGAQLATVQPDAPPRDAAQPPAAPPAAKRLELAATGNFVPTGEPFVTGGATVRAALRWIWLSVGAEARFDAPASAGASVTGAPGARYDAHMIAGALAPCAVYEGESVQPFGCAVVLGGAMTASGTGVSMPGADMHFLLATGSRVGLDIPLHVPRVGLALRASFDALFFPVGARFHLAGSEVWNTPLVSGVGSVGFAVFL